MVEVVVEVCVMSSLGLMEPVFGIYTSTVDTYCIFCRLRALVLFLGYSFYYNTMVYPET